MLSLSLEMQASRLTLRSRNAYVPSRHSGTRGKITAFSKKSRKRLLDLTASMDLKQALQNNPIVFLTLTYGQDFPSAEQSKQHLKAFLMRVRRLAPEASGIWRIEWQERKAPHFHLILFNLPYWPIEDIKEAWLAIIGTQFANNSDGVSKCPNVHIEALKSPRRAFSYVSKYVAKHEKEETADSYISSVPYQHADKFVGRHWGYLNKVALPLGEEIVVDIESSDTVERAFYQFRRLMSKKWQNAKRGKRESGATIYVWSGTDDWYRAFVYCLEQAIIEKNNHKKDNVL